jgi:hypothetical protein
MKKFLLVPAMAILIGACAPSENPGLTQLIKECADKIKEGGPIAVAMTNGDPEKYCRDFAKPLWDLKMLELEQKNFEATKAAKAAALRHRTAGAD